MGTKTVFECWWCKQPTDSDDLNRLDGIVSLGGWAPGPVKDGAHRICRVCAMFFADLRARLEMEKHAVS